MYLGNAPLPVPSTREDRVMRAAHLFDTFSRSHAHDCCRGECLSTAEIHDGMKVSERRKLARLKEQRDSGHPAFGGGRWS